MESKNLFKKFSTTYCRSYRGRRVIEDIVKDLRCSLQFYDTPSFSEMQKGIVDCVGASVITSLVLRHFFRDRKFFVVSLPSVPWLHESFWESKHTGVLEVLKNKNIRIIDPTPINGYGYGTVTKYLPPRSLKRHKHGNKVRYTFPFSDIEMWEEYVYPYFKKLSDRDIVSMLTIDHCRSNIASTEDFSLLTHVPTGASGWAKDFFRLKARFFLKSGKVKEAEDSLKKALAFTPNNVYLLWEYGSFLSKNGQSKEAGKILFKAEKVKEALIKQQKKIIGFWSRHLLKLKKQERWGAVIYYGGAIFWREQSNDLLNRTAPKNIKKLNYKGVLTPMYRFSPGWFKNTGMSVGIASVSKKISSAFSEIDIPTRVSYGKQFRNSYVYNLPSKGRFKCVVGKKKMLERGGCVFVSRTPLEAHRVLTGMVQPEMLIT